jgi:ABC-2 type transport system permease protein
LTSSEPLWRATVVVRSGWAEFLADKPAPIWLATTLPRVVLQCLFFSLLGRIAGGEAGEQYAFIGAAVVTVTLSTLVGICDVPMVEKWFGTSYRLQLGVLRPATTLLLRTLPWVAEGVVSALVAVVVVGPLLGRFALTGQLLAAAPLIVLMALTSAAAGAAAASFAVGRRADVLVGNAFAYLTIATSGALVPPGRLPVLDAIGTVVPLRNGLLALRAEVAGQAWAGHALAELGVGLGWAVLAWAAYRIQFARAARLGLDDYA